MRLTRPTLAAKIDAQIAKIVRRRRRGVARVKTLQTRPRLELRPVDGEVVIGRQARRAGLVADGREKRSRDVALQQPLRFWLNVLWNRIGSSRLKPTNHRNQDAVVDFLDQQPLATDRIQNLQHQRAATARANRRPTHVRIVA
jgi:hypothetical protein